MRQISRKTLFARLATSSITYLHPGTLDVCHALLTSQVLCPNSRVSCACPCGQELNSNQLLCTREGGRILVQPVGAKRFWCIAATNVLIAVPVGAIEFWCIAALLPNGYSMNSEGRLNCERLGAES